jgi:excisionase family DNA binding protein
MAAAAQPNGKEFGNPERLLTIADVAAWLGVSKGWVYDHVTRKQPRLPCIRLGEMTRFRAADIEKFIQEHASGSR